MKKNLIVVATVFILGMSGLAIAQMNDNNKDMMGGGMCCKGMMGMMGDKKMGMCPMMKGMMDKNVVATSDGGIVIVTGNKITKYDKNLNVVKEVELKMDVKGMTDMMKNCPMMKGMGEMNQPAEETKTESGTVSDVDHASHH